MLRSGAADMFHVTYLAIVAGQLYAFTPSSGTLDSWTIGDAEAHATILRPREIGWITALNTRSGPMLLTGGGTYRGLVVLRSRDGTGWLDVASR